MRRYLWRLFAVAMLLQLADVFTAATTSSKALHAVAAAGFGFVAMATRPRRPRALPRHLFRLPRKVRRRG